MGNGRVRPRFAATALVALAAMTAAPAALAHGGILRVTPPHHLAFGRQPFGSFTTRTVTIANRSSRTLVVTISDQSPDDFSPGQPGSTCFLSYTTNVLDPGERCTMIIGFQPAPEFGGREKATLTITAFTAGGRILRTRHMRVTGTGVPAPG